MAGGSFETPTAPKGSTATLIPFRPQEGINQYLTFNSSVKHTIDGNPYIQKNRQTPQRSYRMNWILPRAYAFKLESLLHDPELYYLPLWEQSQRFIRPITAGLDYIDKVTSLTDTDILFNVGNSALIQSGSEWFSEDSQGDYFPPNGQPLQTYCGLGNGSDIYIDTGIPANTIDTFEIVLKWPTITATNKSIFGALDGSPFQRYVLYAYTSYQAIGLGDTTSVFDLSSVVSTGTIYRIQLIKNSATSYTCKVYDTSGNELYNQTDASVTGTIATNNLYIFARNFSTTSNTDSEIYQFSINSETWLLQEQTGDKIVGSLGTVLTVNGTLTNFWQIDNSQPNLLNSTGFKRIPSSSGYFTTSSGGDEWTENAIVRQDPADTDNAFAWILGTDGYVTPDGTDDYVAIPLTALNTEYSMSINIDCGGVAHGAGYRWILNTNGSQTINFGLYQGRPIFFYEGAAANYILSSVTLNTSGWYRITVTVNHTTQESKIYINGTEDTGAVEYGTIPLTAPSFATYCRFAYQSIAGTKLKHFLITDAIPSATEIGYYNSGNISDITNQLLWYKCNEASGDLIDSSGNGNDGTPTNTDSSFYNPSYDKVECDYTGQCQFPAKVLSGNPNTAKDYLNYFMRIIFPTCYEILNFENQFSDLPLSTGLKVSAIDNNHEDLGLIFYTDDPQNKKITNLIGYTSERTALTDPTLDEALSYDPDTDFSVTDYDFTADQWVLIWESNDKYELIQINIITSNKITFKTSIQNSYTNPLIVPVFKALPLGTPSWQKTNSDLISISIDFKLLKNISFDSYTPAETYSSIMVMPSPNFFQDKAFVNTVDPKLIMTDAGQGYIDYYKNFDQSVSVFTWGLKAHGRTEILSMLKMINYFNGQQRLIWIPTLQRDFVPIDDITDVQTVIEIENKGLTAIFGTDGFSRAIALYHNGS